MASGATEGTEENGSAARAGPLKAAAGSECPICLGAVRRPAFVAYCMHQFCFRCIRHWAQGREDCPVCRQALEQVLHSVRGDDDYELFVVGLPTRLRRRMAVDRARSRCPQRRYDLRRRLPTDQPVPGRSEPTASQSEPAPGQSEPTPGQSEPMPGQSEPTPGQSEPMPGQSEPMPGQSEPMPGWSEPTPGWSEPTPRQSEPTPGQREPMPGQSEPMPGQREPMPGQREPTPGQSEPTPGQSEPTPGQSEPTPGQSEPTPGQSEPTPGQSEPMPGQSELTGSGSSQGQGAASGPSRVLAQPAPATGTSWEPSRRTGPGAPPDTHDGTE